MSNRISANMMKLLLRDLDVAIDRLTKGEANHAILCVNASIARGRIDDVRNVLISVACGDVEVEATANPADEYMARCRALMPVHRAGLRDADVLLAAHDAVEEVIPYATAEVKNRAIRILATEG